jgi:phosphoribosylamine-glycine ligase
MKIQITTTTTQVEEKEIEIDLPVCIKTSDYEMAKVISENELILVNVWGAINIARIEVNDRTKNVFTNDYEIIPESEFQSHLNKAKQIIDEAYNKAVVKAVGLAG